MPFSETVEAQGHLIDSHIMEQIFDTVVEFGGRFEVEHFSIGRTNSDASRLRLRVEAPDAEELEKMMTQLLGLGCAPVDIGEAELREAECDRCAPEDFYSTTNQRTLVRVGAQWIEVANQRMDAIIVVGNGTAACRKLRDVKKGDKIVVGMKGIRVVPEAKERDRLQFAFMSNDISSERQVETAVGQTAAIMRQVRSNGKKIIAVAGPVVVHTGGGKPLSRLIRADGSMFCWRGTLWRCMILKPRCWGRRLECARAMGDWRSMGTVTTCRPSTLSIMRGALRRRSKADG